MKTSKEDFELFKAECKKWVEFFGLKCWQISYLHLNSCNEENFEDIAWIEPNVETMSVIFFLNREWVDDKIFYCKEEVKLLAFHEVCELLLTKLDDLAGMRFNVTEERVRSTTHEIIYTLENSVYEKLKTEV